MVAINDGIVNFILLFLFCQVHFVVFFSREIVACFDEIRLGLAWFGLA